MAKKRTITKEYKGEKRFQKDANKLAKDGYRVVSVNDRGKPPLADWFGGPFVKRRIFVTYTKDD